MQRQNPNPYQQEQHQQQQVQQQYSTQEYSHSTQEQHQQQRISRTEQHVQRSQITTQQRGQSVCLSVPVGQTTPCPHRCDLPRLRISASCFGQWDSHRGFRIPTAPSSCYWISIRYRQSPFSVRANFIVILTTCMLSQFHVRFACWYWGLTFNNRISLCTHFA